MLAVGCAGLSPTSKTPQSDSQDIAWKESVKNNTLLLTSDFESVGTALNDTTNLDYTSLSVNGQIIIDDSKKAKEANDQFNVSAKYEDAQKEWVLGLEDAKSSGESMITVAEEGKKGNVNAENVQKMSSLISSAKAHITRTGALIQIADGKV